MIRNHTTREYKGIVLERLKSLPQGGKMGDLPPHLQHESFIRTGVKKTGGPNMRMVRLEMNKPSLTVTAYIFNKFVHPKEHRYVTPREAACLQDFPDDWAFVGGLGEVHHQIGNAVPVKLATAIAASVSEYLVARGHKGKAPIASYFCGAGGLDLGFEAASTKELTFETVFTTDINKACGHTIQLNRPNWNFVIGDITKFSGNAVLNFIGTHPLVVIGGPPCQTFSVAGKQRATHDPLGQLYRDYIKHISILTPEIVILENVYGLKQVKRANVVQEIKDAFSEIGYHVQYQELLAADFGTPQLRRRLIFVATKGKKPFNFPLPTHSADLEMFECKPYAGAGNSFKHLPKAPAVCQVNRSNSREHPDTELQTMSPAK